ncbi:MAG: M1 family metallopeptidase [Gemmatimonadetes bacterium]|nr:M1 family metallopeptidase [Gemmatimonadota bacterium]
MRPPGKLRTPHIVSVLILACVASTAAAQDYSDSYPKNPDIDMLGYVFELTFSDDTDVITGVATATARYLTPGQRELRLDLIEQSESLDGAGMTVSRVEQDGRSLAFRHEDDQVFIDLGTEVNAGDRVTVTVHYSGRPADGLDIGPNKYGDRTFFSDNWSSRVRNWLPVVDHPYDKAMTEMIVVAPSRYQVASNGTVAEATDRGDGTRLTHYVNPVPTATWLYFVGVAQFAVEQVDSYDGIPIETWVYWQDRDDGFHDFAEPSKKTMAYYSDLIGPYVNRRLANIVSNATPGGGMEAASTPAYSDQSVSGNRERRWQHVIIHEIAHQWFGNAVTEYHWNDVWLSEGFATYYTLLARRHLYGHDDFVAGLNESRRTVTDFYEDDFDFQIVRPYIEDLNDVSGSMMYHKGAWVLHMVRDRIGVDSYAEGIRTYYDEHVNAHASTADLRRHLEEASGQDLEDFFDQWLFQGGIPRLEVVWRQDAGEVFVSVQQVQERYGFDLEVDVALLYSDGSVGGRLGETGTVILEAGGGSGSAALIVEDGAEVAGLVVDPNTRLLATWEVRR